MAKTGESYTAAHRILIAGGERPDTETPPFEPPVADEKVAEATERGSSRSSSDASSMPDVISD
jgi:hypothetical protein